ncbi:hypothetical protein U9M48_000613 [Paspalum notatum var. saurae]|uniref:Uncharacterized protein n=1 Tax=Paspalum notatum var. saurae TaxID=547442 RepID=A0AAQ3PIB1_PASNO
MAARRGAWRTAQVAALALSILRGHGAPRRLRQRLCCSSLPKRSPFLCERLLRSADKQRHGGVGCGRDGGRSSQGAAECGHTRQTVLDVSPSAQVPCPPLALT